jgi:hypothetical protein
MAAMAEEPGGADAATEVADPTPPPSEPRPAGRRGRRSRARGQPNSSDEAAARWTIRGVPAPVRDMALRAAETRGMTVGDWVAEAIVTVARAADRADAGPKLPAAEPPPDLGALLSRLDERLTRLEERQTRSFFGRLFGRRT